MKNPLQNRRAMVEIMSSACAGTTVANTSLAERALAARIGLSSALIPLLAMIWLHTPAYAMDHRDVAKPEHFQCVGKSRFSGAAVVPTETYGDPTGRAYAAIYFDSVLGTPLIVYGPRYRLIAPLLQSFIKRHECQHANGIPDEIAANCGALSQMRAQGLSTEQEAQIAQWHAAEGTIDPQYGGSGAAFWERTLRCAGAR